MCKEFDSLSKIMELRCQILNFCPGSSPRLNLNGVTDINGPNPKGIMMMLDFIDWKTI
jgi:hypothetical protein